MKRKKVRCCILLLFFVWFMGFRWSSCIAFSLLNEILGLCGLLKGNLCVVSLTTKKKKNQRECLWERGAWRGGFWTYQWKELGMYMEQVPDSALPQLHSFQLAIKAWEPLKTCIVCTYTWGKSSKDRMSTQAHVLSIFFFFFCTSRRI